MEAALAPNSITFDTEVNYEGNDRFPDYNREILANDEDENVNAGSMDNGVARKLASYTASRCSLGKKRSQLIIDREDDYKRRRLNQDEISEETKGMPDGLPFMKPLDYHYFGALLNEEDEDELSPDKQKERKIMKLLLQFKNGTPPLRKTTLGQLVDKSCEFGPEPLFNVILPLLMQPTLEDQERHLLLKVVDRVVYKLDDLVRPYVLRILIVIEPMLVDEEYYDARVEGRQILSTLCKASGLATMTDAMHEYVRNTTARAFSVVASAVLGIPALLPILKTACESRRSICTGIKIVGQIAILIGGCAVLLHLTSLVEIIKHGLNDENQKVKTITALSLAALAEVAAPYGIESFDSVLKPLLKGIRSHRGEVLAAFIKAIGFIIPLMDDLYAAYYTEEVMSVLIRELQSPDEETKRIVLKAVKQCVSTEGVEGYYIRNDILEEFFRNFWVRRMDLNDREYKQQLVETTVEIAKKVDVAVIVYRIVEGLRDESETYRRMVMETIGKVVANLGASDIDPGLEELLIDGILYAFQEQTVNDDDADVMLNGFVAVVNSLGQRVKPYCAQICGTINWRLDKNRSAKVRQQAADLISRIAVVMKQCQEEQLMVDLGVVLYEYLGEVECPAEVLGSILGALTAIVNVIGMNFPPIKDNLLLRLTPILKNLLHEKVQKNCIDLVGCIADHDCGAASMWICFELLLEKLKAHNRGSIRRATVNTFRHIAKAIGPRGVLAILLNNLKVQEMRNETLAVALMNEYRVVRVQNDVLKSLSFLFEYIGEMGKDYIHAVTPLLEDALMDPRNLVHRRTAASVVKHMALGVAGLGCEDALRHLFNCLWPNNNIFETLPPDDINAVMEAVDGCTCGCCYLSHVGGRRQERLQ